MSILKPNYRANNQSITCTFTSLANNAQRSSAAIDNTANLDDDALVVVKVKSASASTSATGLVNVYAYGSADGGSTYPEGCGSDAGTTLTAPTNLRLIGIINVVANSTTYQSEPMSVAAAFNGNMPDHWGICIENKTGATLDASVGSAWFLGIQYTIA